MLKTGVCSEPKDGGPQTTTHEIFVSPAVISKGNVGEIRSSGVTFRTSTNFGNQRELNVGTFQHQDGAAGNVYPPRQSDVSLSVSAIPPIPSDNPDNLIPKVEKSSRSMEEVENEIIDNQGLDWLKSSVQSAEVDMLEMETKPVPTSIPGLSIMDSGSELSHLSENLTDFVFSSTLPDNILIKQGVVSNYSEVLECADQVISSSASSCSTPNMTSWNSSSQSLQVQSGALSHLSSTPGPFVSYSDDSILPILTCSSTDLNGILFPHDSSSNSKPDLSTVEIVQYSDALNFAVDRSFMCSDGSVNNLNSMPVSNAKSLPLTFTGTIADQEVSLPNLQEGSNDLTLNSLPNFLGLENSVSNTSSGNSLIDTHADNMLEGISPSVVSVNHAEPAMKTEIMERQILHDNSQLTNSNPNLSVTTISISNDEENATKILVDTHQGQQQMYVINTADLNMIQNQTCTAKVNASQGNMYVINTTDLAQGTHNISTADSSVENVSITPDSQALGSHSQSAFTTSGISGFVLMPVVDSTSNVIQAVPLQISDAESDSKRPTKKLLMCTEPGCHKTFKKASKLKVHQMLHTGERPFKCTLLGCEWAFTTSNKLKRHMESHEGRKDYVCDKPGCGHRFTTVYNLNTHRKLHDRPCTEPCTEEGCNQRFPTKRQLDLHLRNVHSCEDRTYKCPQPGCEKVFFSSGCMGSHMKVHQQNLEELKCKFPGCGKEFSKMCRLRQHERLHSGERPFICDYQGCTWAFATASKLKRHQTKHTGVRKWVCGTCKKQFHRSEHLKGHLITHSGDRPFVCPVEGCGNTFTAKSSLYVHLKKHDESGKTIVYHCPMEKCERHYANKASLRQHILVKHCSVPQKGASPSSEGVANWLSVLGTGDANCDVTLSQETYSEGEGLAQTALTPSRDAVLATDFLTGGMADQALLNSSSESIPDQSCNNLISQLMVPSGITLTTPAATMSMGTTVPLHSQQRQHGQQNPQHSQQQQQSLFTEDQINPRLLEAGEILQQQERMSFEAVERGKKSQIMLENVHGSARTDPRSNDIISQRAMKRWQKQKEIEAAKLRAQLDAQTRPMTTCSNIVINASGDYKSPVSNNVSLASQQLVHTVVVSRNSSLDGVSAVKAEIPDMELQAEGISDSVLDGSSSADSFMTELFIRDPETGITYRQTQLLQDDPPNPELLEDLEGVAPSHSMVLDPSLDSHFVDDSLNFHHLEQD